MKKILLLAAAALMVSSANAQIKRSEATLQVPARPQMQLIKPEVKVAPMQKRAPGAPIFKAPKKADAVNVSYRRPAGAFAATVVVEDGANSGTLYAPYIAVTPYVDYTFNGVVKGASPDATMEWDVQYWAPTPDGTDEVQTWEKHIPGMDLTMQYGYEVDSVPIFRVLDSGKTYEWYIRGHKMGGTYERPRLETRYSADIAGVPNMKSVWDYDILKSSKTFCGGGRNADQYYPMIYYTGAEPNQNGYWFGTNGYHQVENPRFFIDGIAQAFEKPTFPYLLKQVVVACGTLVASGPVEMKCRIYKLDEIPAYEDSAEVLLPEIPGELIAQGKALVTPETDEATGGLVFFTLYDEYEGMEYDITPTIDCPILVVVDGYNDPEMANLTEFSAMISTDDATDEGYGELAYLKFGMADEEGNVDYVWNGLNNFFSSGEMKTGLTIFLSTENPWLTFNYNAEDGEYTFPNEGGLMEKHFDGGTTRSIEFWAWTPSADDAWYMYCGEDDVPEWLDIKLTDRMSNGQFTGIVNAEVTAEPLPAGMSYREAVVRFEFPGAYIDYTFKQGVGGPEPFLKGDVNNDGEVGIADVNALINLILGGEPTDDMMLIRADVNEDGEIGIADVNYLLTLI